MADFAFSATLNDAGFRQGLARMKGAGDTTAKAIGQILKFGGAAIAMQTAFQYASSAVDAYTARYSYGRSAVRGLSTEIEQFKLAIGRDLVGAIDSSGGALGGWLTSLNKARTGVVNFLADFGRGRGESADVDEARKGVEATDRQQEKNLKDQEKEAQRRMRADAAMAAIKGDKTANAIAELRAWGDATSEITALEMEREAELAKLNEQAATLDAFDKQNTDLMGARNAILDKYTRLLNNVRGAESDKANAAAASDAEARARFEQEAALHAEAMAFRLQEAAIEAQGGAGGEETVEKARLELNLRRQIADLRRDEQLTAAQKIDAERALTEIYRLQVATINAQSQGSPSGPTRFRTLGAGLGPGAASQVLGGGRSEAAVEQKRTNTTLEAIRQQLQRVVDQTRGGVGATFQ